MRFCPLTRITIPCSEAAPLCPWCELKAQTATPKRDDIREQAVHQNGEANNQQAQSLSIAVVSKPLVREAQRTLSSGIVTVRAPRTCIDCGVEYAPSGNHQQRCQSCAAEHNRMKNRAYQAGFRQRQRERVQA